MSNVGFATLQIIPSARGFGAALNTQTAPSLASAGAAGGKKFGGSMLGGLLPMAKSMGVIGGGLAVGGIISSSINLEKQFSQTMNSMAAVANVPKPQIKELSALALKMGADTVFSANDAAQAMLELAKGGLSAANIQGGALKATLTLAAAGGLDLASAATYSSNALNTFHLKGKDAGAVAAALAGGANASSASVESLGQALGQVGPGAVNAGLSLQETVAALSAFDNAGIKGSDAGTSLKTMLARLIPQTDKASGAMQKLGLNFVNADGSFKSIGDIAGQLHDKLGNLSEATRSQALTTIFGSDASRAAAVLMDQGKSGIEAFTKATSDMGAAQRVADSRMSGTAGAIEAMKGSAETAKLALGQLLAPLIIAGSHGLATAFNSLALNVAKVGPFLQSLKPYLADIETKFRDVAAVIMPVLMPAFTAIGNFVQANLQPILIGFGVALAAVGLPLIFGAIGAAVSLLAGAFALLFSPVILTIAAITAVVAGAILAYQHFETFRNVVDTVVSFFINTVLPKLQKFAAWLMDTIPPVLTSVWGAFTTAFSAITNVVGTFVGWITGKIQGFVDWARPTFKLFLDFLTAYVPPVFNFLKGYFEVWFGAVQAVFTVAMAIITGAWSVAWGVISAAVRAVWALMSSIISGALNIIGGIIRTALALLTGNWSEAWNGIKQILTGVWTIIQGAIKAGVILVLAVFKELPGNILKALGNLSTALYEAGKDLIRGFMNGIKDMVGAVAGAVKDVVGGAVDTAKGLLGIHSPSRVFAEIGRFTGEGFAIGVESMVDRSQEAMAAMVAPPSLADVDPFGTSGRSSSVAAGSSNVVDAVEALAAQLDGLRAEVRRQTDRSVLLTKTGVQR